MIFKITLILLWIDFDFGNHQIGSDLILILKITKSSVAHLRLHYTVGHTKHVTNNRYSARHMI